MRRLTIALFSGLTLLCLLLAAPCLLIPRMAANVQTYSAGFSACADARAMGVLPSQYDTIAQALSRYFSRQADTPQVEILKNDAHAAAFNDKELQHLSDVRTLFQALHTAGLILSAAAAALLGCTCAAGLGKGFSARTLARSVLLGWAGAMALIAILLLWAALDFNSLFVLMHRLLFNNTLWLMDPQTDLIILLMPEAFFSMLAMQLLRLLARTLWPLAAILAILLYFSFKPMKSGKPI